jgi:hypothetical protein
MRKLSGTLLGFHLINRSLESLPDIVHTKDGSAVVRLLIARGTAKVRDLYHTSQ